MNGKVYTTSIPTRVNFAYEVAIDSDADLDEATGSTEEAMARLVGHNLIKCELLDLNLADLGHGN